MSGRYNRKYSSHNNLYTHTSTAYEIQPKADPYDYRAIEEKRIKSRREAIKMQNIAKTEKNIKNRRSKIAKDRTNAFLFSITVIVGIFCAILTLNTNDKKVTILNDIEKQGVILKANAEEIKNLEYELAQSYDIIAIEEQAKTRLNMGLPTPSQIYSIELPKANYVSYAKIVEPEKTGINKLIDKIGQVIK